MTGQANKRRDNLRDILWKKETERADSQGVIMEAKYKTFSLREGRIGARACLFRLNFPPILSRLITARISNQ